MRRGQLIVLKIQRRTEDPTKDADDSSFLLICLWNRTLSQPTYNPFPSHVDDDVLSYRLKMSKYFYHLRLSLFVVDKLLRKTAKMYHTLHNPTIEKGCAHERANSFYLLGPLKHKLVISKIDQKWIDYLQRKCCETR